MTDADARLRRARLDAAVTMLERLQAHGYYLHDASGHALDKDEFITAICEALSDVDNQAVLAAPQSQKCPACNGTGGGENRMGGPEWTCETCKGTGQAMLAAPAEPPHETEIGQLRALIS